MRTQIGSHVNFYPKFKLNLKNSVIQTILPAPPPQKKNGIISYTDSQYFKSVRHLTDKDFAYFVFTKDGKLSICLLSENVEVWPYFYPNFFFFSIKFGFGFQTFPF